MRILLSSRGIETDKYKKLFLQSTKGLIKNISIITTASEKYKEKNKNAIQLRSDLTELGYKCKFVDIEYDNLELLQKTEIIIINGGNPYYLLHHLKKSRCDELILKKVKNNKLVIGISAGAFIFMKNLSIVDLITPEMNTINLLDKKGLGVINETIIPHFDRFVKNGIIKVDKIKQYEENSNKRIIRLGEDEIIEYLGNNFRII